MNNGAEIRLVAKGQKTREGLRQQHGLVDANLVLTPPEARRRIAGDSHDSICGQRLRQRHFRMRAATAIGGDGAEPEREDAKISSQHSGSRIPSPAPTL